MGGLKIYITVFKEAAGPHWLRTIVVFSGGAYGAYSAAEAVTASHDLGFLLPTLPKVAVTITVALALIIFWLIQYAVKLRGSLDPSLSLSFEDANPFAYDVQTPRGLLRCYRFRVTNIGGTPLQSCKAQLTSMIDDDGKNLVSIPFSLQRSHSGNEVFPLRRGEEKFIDLIAVSDNPSTPAKVAACGEPWPDHSAGSYLPRRRSIVTVQVLSEAAPAKMRLRWEEAAGRWGLKQVSPA